jgi:adenylate cyclase
MAQQVLIVQTERQTAQPLVDYFGHRGDTVTVVVTGAEALASLDARPPALVFFDLHLPEATWLETLRLIRQRRPQAAIILTNQHPDFQREMLAKESGATVFLRQPYTAQWIERALQRLAAPPAERAEAKPVRLASVRMPVRLKITLPFIILAGLFAIAGAYLISRYVSESIRERFDNQLLEAGTLAADWMVREEERELETLRLIANTQGVADAIAARDPERLRALALPIAVNAQAEAVEILDRQGQSLLSLRRDPAAPTAYTFERGDVRFAEWLFVQQVLQAVLDQQGDKFAGVVNAPWGQYLYLAGPVYPANSTELAGVVLVGKPLTMLADQMRQSTLAQVTLYDFTGQPLATSLDPAATAALALEARTAADIAALAGTSSFVRNVTVVSTNYGEIIGRWQARNGTALGLIGVALPQNFLAQPTLITQFQGFLVVLAGLGLVIVIGFGLANQITNPLRAMVTASRAVADGNFQVKLPAAGNDEVTVLEHAFNYMVSGLQEGSIYRDLLGRTVSPEVREELRASFATGDLRLEGQLVNATVLMSDIRGFTTLSEKADPTTVLKWLNEYFSELVPVIAAHGGVVDKFEGDAILAFFGILPRPLPPRESAYQACQAALDMLQVIEHINARRADRGEPPFVTGIGLNTGSVTAGGLGASDRLNYTIIGDTVNTTQRIESFTRQFAESSIVVSESTCSALKARQRAFSFQSLGEHMFKGKSKPVALYRLLPGEPGTSVVEHVEPELEQVLS